MEIQQNIKLAVDAIVFGYYQNSLRVLLVQQKFGLTKGQWALVGGFVKDNEGLSEAVHRELKEEAGIEVQYLEQLYTFGDNLERDPRCRVVSVAYFALVNSQQYHPVANTDAAEAKWFDIKELPPLAYDHQQIVETAHERLKAKLRYQPIGFDLLPKEFLFSELESLYSTILEVELDRRNFRKKMMYLQILEETDLIASKSKGRPAKYFKFNVAAYKASQAKGIHFEI